MRSIVVPGAPVTNHAATGSRCADEGLSGPLDVGQVWAYYSADGEYGVVLEYYSLVSRVSYKKARKSMGLGPQAARRYQFWHVVVTSALSGSITTRTQAFPPDMHFVGYRRIV